MADDYLEAYANVDVADWEELFGRIRAGDIDKPWPMPPDYYTRGCTESRKPEYFQRYFVRFNRHAIGEGGVLRVSPELLAMSGQEQQLTDGETISVDIEALKVPYEGLSVVAQQTVDGGLYT